MPSAFEADRPRFWPTPCPHCGEPLKPVPIVYGYPTSDTFEAAERGEVALGGCLVNDVDPQWASAACMEPVA